MLRPLPAAAILIAFAILPACAAQPQSAAPARAREPVVGLPCEGCDAVFEGLPAALTARARIAPPDEPGRPLRINGTVFDAVRPGGYPDSDLPEHVYLHVIEVGRCTYYIDDVLFDDDPRPTAAKRATPTMDESGVQVVVRDIHLGRGIPGYPGGGYR